MVVKSAAEMSVSWCKNFIKLNVPNLSGNTVTISNIYLRDNSQEPSSFNKISQQRIHSTNNIDIDIQPITVDVIENDDVTCHELTGKNEGAIRVVWSDKHESKFDFDWIRENVMRKQRETRVKKITWSSDGMSGGKVSLPYKEVMDSVDALSMYMILFLS